MASGRWARPVRSRCASAGVNSSRAGMPMEARYRVSGRSRVQPGKHGLRSTADAGFGEIPNWGQAGINLTVEILQEHRRRMALHAVGVFQGDHDTLYAGRWLRPHASVLIRRSARRHARELATAQPATCRRSSRSSTTTWRRCRICRSGRILEQRDPGRAWQASDRPGLYRSKARMDEIARQIDAQTKEAELI